MKQFGFFCLLIRSFSWKLPTSSCFSLLAQGKENGAHFIVYTDSDMTHGNIKEQTTR